MIPIEYAILNESHLDSLETLEQMCFSIPWSKNLFRNEIGNSQKYYVVALSEGNVIGYGGIAFVLDEGDIMNIAVHPDFRKKGIGSGILTMLIEYATDKSASLINLELRESNENAYNMYKKFGFETVGKRKEYYSDNKEDALLMTKYII